MLSPNGLEGGAAFWLREVTSYNCSGKRQFRAGRYNYRVNRSDSELGNLRPNSRTKSR